MSKKPGDENGTLVMVLTNSLLLSRTFRLGSEGSIPKESDTSKMDWVVDWCLGIRSGLCESVWTVSNRLDESILYLGNLCYLPQNR